ncbi:glucose-1-phosphate adenylyltransferase subunit GlgD [Marinilactibacillus sp. Marseille-P9653]|uniref:glucose-1-phosphate adenylyltransferase subunit GlgD n=1 Tax=Marinilactibacillus sp. Marseille-P9653 TaxID=2866583 RepID=UPI001CE43451|nr:glucose-1-phosphate adenylyltransferase subunit GlgD [Marinilactibacillus sp. Marseille-P9653]
MRNEIAAIFNLVENEDKLRPLTERRPIASLPFACRYRLIDFPFSSLYNAEAISAALFISESGHSLYDHIRSGATWGLDSIAGGGVFTHSQIRLKTSNAEEGYTPAYYDDHYKYVTRSHADYILLMGSSMLSNIQIKSIVNYHNDKSSDVTIAYKKMDRKAFREDTAYSSYEFYDEDTGRINKIVPLTEIGYEETGIPVGIEVMVINKKTFLNYLQKARERNLCVSVKTFSELALQDDDGVYGFEYTGYLKAIEDIKSYFEANMEMLNEDNFNALFYRADPVLTRSKNSAPTFYGENAEIHNSQVANDCEIYGSVKNSLIFRKANIAKNAKVENSIIMQDCYIEEDVYLNYVILDKHVYVKKGVRLEGTPENPIVISKNSVVDGDNS